MFETRNDLTASVRTRAVKLLNERLADAIDLGTQVKYAHWNVKGPAFMALHELFDKLAAAIAGQVDTLAERATALGGTAEGTLAQVARASSLKPYPHGTTEGSAHVRTLAAVLGQYGARVRAAIETAARLGDAGTCDLFTGVSREVDKSLWFLEAHLQGKR